MPEQITIEDAYAELCERYRRPLTIQQDDITIAQFARDTGNSVDRARSILEKLVEAGQLQRVERLSEHKRAMYAYRIVTQ